MVRVKVTVLVAIYNSELYLRECLDSLLAQTLKDIQIVCVDDASTDGSWQILQAYAARDQRIETIHLTKNGGQAKARNVGLAKARGEYTCFLDSDDFLAADALEKIVACFGKDTEYDSVLFRCLLYDSETKCADEYPMELFKEKTGYEAFVDSLTWKIHGVYAVKTTIHQRYPYDDSLHSYSDDNTTRLHYLASRKVAYCEGIYYYRQHASSVTHQVSLARLDYLKANAKMKQTLRQLDVDDKLLDLYENHRWLNVVGIYQFAIKHRASFAREEWDAGMLVIYQTWLSIEAHRLQARNHYKLGYMLFHLSWLPDKWGWRLFRWEEYLYFGLRRIFNRFPQEI